MSDKHVFIIKPVGVEANQRLCELLGPKTTESECGSGYEVSIDDFVFVYKSNRSSGLQYEFFVKFNGEINPVHFVPDHRLSSVDALQELTNKMLEKLRPLRRPNYSGPQGVMPWNALPRRMPRKIIPTRVRR